MPRGRFLHVTPDNKRSRVEYFTGGQGGLSIEPDSHSSDPRSLVDFWVGGRDNEKVAADSLRHYLPAIQATLWNANGLVTPEAAARYVPPNLDMSARAGDRRYGYYPGKGKDGVVLMAEELGIDPQQAAKAYVDQGRRPWQGGHAAAAQTGTDAAASSGHAGPQKKKRGSSGVARVHKGTLKKVALKKVGPATAAQAGTYAASPPGHAVSIKNAKRGSSGVRRVYKGPLKRVTLKKPRKQATDISEQGSLVIDLVSEGEGSAAAMELSDDEQETRASSAVGGGGAAVAEAARAVRGKQQTQVEGKGEGGAHEELTLTLTDTDAADVFMAMDTSPARSSSPRPRPASASAKNTTRGFPPSPPVPLASNPTTTTTTTTTSSTSSADTSAAMKRRLEEDMHAEARDGDSAREVSTSTFTRPLNKRLKATTVSCEEEDILPRMQVASARGVPRRARRARLSFRKARRRTPVRGYPKARPPINTTTTPTRHEEPNGALDVGVDDGTNDHADDEDDDDEEEHTETDTQLEGVKWFDVTRGGPVATAGGHSLQGGGRMDVQPSVVLGKLDLTSANRIDCRLQLPNLHIITIRFNEAQNHLPVAVYEGRNPLERFLQSDAIVVLGLVDYDQLHGGPVGGNLSQQDAETITQSFQAQAAARVRASLAQARPAHPLTIAGVKPSNLEERRALWGCVEAAVKKASRWENPHTARNVPRQLRARGADLRDAYDDDQARPAKAYRGTADQPCVKDAGYGPFCCAVDPLGTMNDADVFQFHAEVIHDGSGNVIIEGLETRFDETAQYTAKNAIYVLNKVYEEVNKAKGYQLGPQGMRKGPADGKYGLLVRVVWMGVEGHHKQLKGSSFFMSMLAAMWGVCSDMRVAGLLALLCDMDAWGSLRCVGGITLKASKFYRYMTDTQHLNAARYATLGIDMPQVTDDNRVLAHGYGILGNEPACTHAQVGNRMNVVAVSLLEGALDLCFKTPPNDNPAFPMESGRSALRGAVPRVMAVGTHGSLVMSESVYRIAVANTSSSQPSQRIYPPSCPHDICHPVVDFVERQKARLLFAFLRGRDELKVTLWHQQRREAFSGASAVFDVQDSPINPNSTQIALNNTAAITALEILALAAVEADTLAYTRLVVVGDQDERGHIVWRGNVVVTRQDVLDMRGHDITTPLHVIMPEALRATVEQWAPLPNVIQIHYVTDARGMASELGRITNDERNYGEQLKGIEADLGNRYLPMQLLGRGAFGKVVRAHDQITRAQVVVKIFERADVGEWRQETEKLRELSGFGDYQQTGQPYIVRIYRAFHSSPAPGSGTPAGYSIVLESLGCSLADVMQAYPNARFSMAAIIELGRCVFRGLSFLHRHNLVHCDLKSKNVVLMARNVRIENGIIHANSFRAKIIDLGNCLSVEDLEQQGTLGTQGYMPAEVEVGDVCGAAIDIWSAAMTLGEMYVGEYVIEVLNDTPTRPFIIAMIRRVVLTDGAQVAPFPVWDWQPRRANNRYDDVFDDAGDVKFPPPQQNWFRRKWYHREHARDRAEVTAYENATPLWEELRQEDGNEGVQLFELLRQCLRASPTDRLTADQALNHEFLTP